MKMPIGFLAVLCSTVFAGDDGFLERFADPATRDAVVSELPPGTRDAYFHGALVHQLAGRQAEFWKTLGEWKAAATRKEDPVANDGLDVLENRQILIEYKQKPKESLEFLIHKFGLKFDHARPDAAAAANLPTRLDPAWITGQAFEKVAEQQSRGLPYEHYQNQRLFRELERVATFDEAKVRWFLAHLKRADLPGVEELVSRSLSFKTPVEFGSQWIHGALTLDQLGSLRKKHPSLAANEVFNLTWLARLKPGADVLLDRDRRARAEYLGRCRDHVLGLPAAMNALKAHVLYHHLVVQQELGNHPKEDFLAYLALPRIHHPILLTRKDVRPEFPVDTRSDYGLVDGCGPVSEDLPLIESYLDHFLGEVDSAADFANWIEAGALRRRHARARLLAGGDAQRWGKHLDPEEFAGLRDEPRISFAPGAAERLKAADPADMTLDLKNTPELLVRIYQIDAAGYLARHASEPDASIDLDGLVPHHERRMVFSQPPMVRHREKVALPELAGAGVWLVEFVSGRVSARSLVRKGWMTPFVERTATGQTVRVFDENHRPVPSAVLTLGGDSLVADASGRIVVPNAPNHPPVEGVLSAGPLATTVALGDRAEILDLRARFHLDREQLLADQEARLHLWVRLGSHDCEVPLDRIKNPVLVLHARLLGGITTERVIAENLKLQPRMEIPFQVPADLEELTLSLHGTVEPATGGDPVMLSQQAVFRINADLNSARVATPFFSPTAEGLRLEVRGRNGEPMPSRPVTLTCRHRDYKPSVVVNLRTDDQGRIDLGHPTDIDSLTASGPDIAESECRLDEMRFLEPASRLQIMRGEDVRLPLLRAADRPDRAELSLMETLDGKPVHDHFDKITIDRGQIVIRNLPEGCFLLVQGDLETEIVVSGGDRHDDLLVSDTQIVPASVPFSPVIAETRVESDRVRIALAGQGPGTRVSLVGRRYYQDLARHIRPLLPFSPPVSESVTPGFIGCYYLTDRRIDDETRYILDRRAAKIFPGSMLPRPGLLLNRWTDEDVTQQKQYGLGNSEGLGSAGKEFGMDSGMIPSAMRKRNAVLESAAVCDFLAKPSVVRVDLTPDATGVVDVPLADFRGCQFIEIVACDALASDARILPLPASDTPLRDRRIARPLDPAAHHLATRSAAVLAKGAQAEIENLLDADWRAFTTLEEARQFLYGMKPDNRIREFEFLTNWPDLSVEKKLELLSKHACHELHLFLARKDRAFFDKYVKPMIARKAEPEFMDDLLLGRDLQGYLRPYAWQRLNAAEKALLAQGLPAARQRIARELARRWELEAPAPDVETRLFTQTLRGTDLATRDSLGLAKHEVTPAEDLVFSDTGGGGSAYITDKLSHIIIPRIDFEDTTIEEAIKFLRMRSMELDTLELDPAKKGINMVVRGGRNLQIRELHLKQVPFAVALKYICDATKLRYKVDDFAVILMPQTETGDDTITRTFNVPPDFMESLEGAGQVEASADPFAEPSGGGAKRIEVRRTMKDLLRMSGLHFPEGTSASLTSDGKLVVTNTAAELDKMESLVDANKMPVTPATPQDSSILPEMDADGFSDPLAGALARRPMAPAKPEPPRMFPDRTRLWRESNYYRHAGATDESLIPLNRFWIDLAAWDGNGVFLSANFNACHGGASDALMCLAMLDLPFKAERPEVSVDGNLLRVKAREPMVLFYKDTRRTDKLAKESPLLIRQMFCPFAEKFVTVNGRQVENPVNGEFRPGVPYGASLIVTNPTGIGRRIDVLAQIPAGAIPLDGKPATLASTHEIAPHGVLTLEQAFYFPAPGEFEVYPMHVGENGVVQAHATRRVLKVVADSAAPDAASWGLLAANGSSDQVLERLRTVNLGTLDFMAIRWRLKDRAFFSAVSAILTDRLFRSPVVDAYGLYHGDAASVSRYLENEPIAGQLGQWLDSPLLEIRPRVHHDWRTLEFDPLVNPRAHRFGDGQRMTHQAARAHYQAFLGQLAWKPALDASDQLTLTAYLFLQDRIDEAIDRFGKVDPAKLPSRLHYDYLQCLVNFYQENPAAAGGVAARVLPVLPPGLWRDRFQAVVDQAGEVAALSAVERVEVAKEAGLAPRLDLFANADGRLTLRHRGLERVELRFYQVDVEMMFSKNPFLGNSDGGDEPSILPNKTLAVALDKHAGETVVDLPETLRRGSLLVSARSGATKLLKVPDSGALEVVRRPGDRSLRVLDAATRKPLPKTYVKVYVENRSGEVEFHKDGYTDLRGMFDYISHTGKDPSTIKRSAILVSHPEKGVRTMICE